MRRSVLLFFAILLSIPFIANAQEEEKSFGIKWAGYIKNDAVYNSRRVISARGENQFLLSPRDIDLDAAGNDINAVPNFNLIGIETRLKGAISGPDAFGAKTSGYVEGDFFGTSAGTKFSFRLRHAFVKMNWEDKGLTVLSGQYWHPTFVTDCYPGTVSFGAGVPFNPLSRNPQIRISKTFGSLNVFLAVLSEGHFKSKAGATAHMESGIPEGHLQVQYKQVAEDGTGIWAGAGFGYKVLKPALSTTSPLTGDAYKTTFGQNVSSMTAHAYIKYKIAPVTVKLWGMYGQGNDNMVMMGGFAQRLNAENLSTAEIQHGGMEYTPFNVASGWLDINSNGSTWQAGLFAGYSKNLGSNNLIVSGTEVGRWMTAACMARVAPRLVFISGKLKIAVEAEYGVLYYGDRIDNYGKPIDVDYTERPADNIKGLLSFVYSF